MNAWLILSQHISVKCEVHGQGEGMFYAHRCITCYRKMLAEGGTAVDAYIAVSLCLGVLRTVSSGVGGGAFLNFYNRFGQVLFIHGVIISITISLPRGCSITIYL